MALSTRGLYSKEFKSDLMKWDAWYQNNPHNSVTNPLGVINMGSAENYLCEDIWFKKLNEPKMTQFDSSAQFYFNYKGCDSFRKATANFLTERFKAHTPVDHNNLTVVSGVGAAFDLLAYAFAEEGDYFLCLAPLYSVIVADLGNRSKNKLYPVQLPGRGTKDKIFTFTIDMLENAMAKAKEEGKVIRGLILLNPSNPLGLLLDKQLLAKTLDFCHRNDLHVICDEIYGLSVWAEGSQFISVLSLDHIPDPNKTHMLWGFSKDFGLSGFRCGIIHSWNPDFFPCVSHMLSWASVPPVVQYKLQNILLDKEWLDTVYFPTNLSLMRENREYVKSFLLKYNVTVSDTSKAAFFMWADFSKLLKNNTKEAEIAFFEEIFSNGVFILPGSAFLFQETGWFRMLFTLKRSVLDEGFRRLEKVLTKYSPSN